MKTSFPTKQPGVRKNKKTSTNQPGNSIPISSYKSAPEFVFQGVLNSFDADDVDTNKMKTSNHVNKPTTKPAGVRKYQYRQRRRKAYPLLPCHVCGETAGKHCYYGGQACFSCRAFFKRAVESDGYKGFFCMKDRQCQINLKSRKKCKYCRYQACLVAGMKTVWVFNEKEKKNFLDNRKKNKNPEAEAFRKPAPPPPLRNWIGSLRDWISDKEIMEVTKYVKTSGYFDISKVNDMELGLIREIIR